MWWGKNLRVQRAAQRMCAERGWSVVRVLNHPPLVVVEDGEGMRWEVDAELVARNPDGAARVVECGLLTKRRWRASDRGGG